MRVRISFDALRLCLLVAAGVTSGYLWRAAFESSSPEERLAATPRVIQPAPAPPVVRIPPSRVTSRERPAVVHHVLRPTPARQVARGSATLISRPAATPPKPQPESNPPTPTPTPTSPPPTPPSTPPPPTTTPPPPPSPTPATTAATTQVAAAPPPTPPATSAASDGSRPGWGKGDENHDHTGPGKP
jgi:hypothetical protein